jgi:putative FmdB family regulatory protein
MPVYEFLCEGCGAFEQRRSFAEASEPMTCPSCGEVARRTYSMPATKNTPTTLSNALNRAEKSAHEPEVARQPTGGTRYRTSHGGHHGHNH